MSLEKILFLEIHIDSRNKREFTSISDMFGRKYVKAGKQNKWESLINCIIYI